MNNVILLDIDTYRDRQSVTDQLNTPKSIEIFGFSNEEYEAIKPIDISRIGQINSTLKSLGSDLQISTIYDPKDMTWSGAIVLNRTQHEVIQQWDKGYEYPFFNVDWFQLKLYHELYFE